ncbi:hypothetical protein [Caulobacter sp. 17J80-11]|uniref:hypothetical protein n=1 Tax=Caulobacter sp. 17J80-11 TaxID=2763502 RepID=UPI001653E16F|nr:hypothetical protein [Caulobacter sp. 17J80-11]MBC6983354.1 hypothetical protein [Caulobacter sp. 17J80-11]
MADEHDAREPTSVSEALRLLRLNRRRVLTILAAGAATSAAAQNRTPSRTPPGGGGRRPSPIPGGRGPQVTIDLSNLGRRRDDRPKLPDRMFVVRPDDMVVLEVEPVGLKRSAGRLVRSGGDALLIVDHPAQAIAEQAYWKTSGQASNTAVDKTGAPYASPGDETPLPTTPAPSRLAGRSRVVVRMPTGQIDLPCTLEGILEACRTWPLVLDPAARPAPPEAVRAGRFTVPLDAATAVLAGSLPVGARDKLKPALETASTKVAAGILAGARGGKPLDDAAIDALIAREVDAATKTSGGTGVRAKLTPEQTASVRGLVEASAMTTVGDQAFAFIDQKPHKPAEKTTQIELPWRLVQSPLPGAGFDHQTLPVNRGGRIELWHSRLGARRDSPLPGQHVVDDRAAQPVRALWSPDYDKPLDDINSVWALTGQDRRMLVLNMADYTAKTLDGKKFTPRPSRAKRLMLSALGGWLDAEGAWQVRPKGSDIEAWKHKTAQARDYYVRVVYAGFLFPTGHAASLVKETERVFETQSDGGRVAMLRQRSFIIVREKTRTYPGANQAFGGYDLPFKQIDVLTEVTPDLNQPGKPTGASPNALDVSFYGSPDLVRQAFWPTTADGDMAFKISAVDAAGRRIGFDLPMMFVSDQLNAEAAKVAAIAGFYNAGNQLTRRKRTLGGQTVQMAPGEAGAEDVHMPASSVTFRGAGATSTEGMSATAPLFYPGLEGAEVKLRAVEAMTGAVGARAVSFNPTYLREQFGGSNAGQVFLDLVAKAGAGSSEQLGGLISPNFAPSALSRKYGAVGGKSDPGSGGADAVGSAAQFLKGEFNPADFIPDDVMLLGAFPLSKVLKLVALAAEVTGTEIPRLSQVQFPDRIEAKFEFEQKDLDPPAPIDEIFKPIKGKNVFSLSSSSKIWLNGKPAETRVDGALTHFRINLFGCLIVHFVNLAFSAEPGRKPRVDVDLDPDHGVEFGGPLSFVNKLREMIPSDGFADPVGLSVTPAGINAGYSLTLPPIAIGVLTLQNVMIGAAFNLPFMGGKPNARFNFAERESPFNLTVSLFGGGGFVALGVDTGGVREVEAALEFGAQISVDLGVASGGVYVKGGFYFHWVDESGKERVELEAYVEMGGHLSVLGLITVSLTFHLGLCYEKAGDEARLFGQATLTVEIEILFFSISVDVTVEKQFAGSKDPLITDLTTADDYARYCAAFA